MSELSTRAAVFCCFGQLGNLAGGWVQAGLLDAFAEKGGLAAWRWLFIIISVITIPIAAFGTLGPHASSCHFFEHSIDGFKWTDT